MQAPLDLVWKHLLPALGGEALPANSGAERELRARLSSLKVRTPVGDPASPRATELSGRTYALEPNEQRYEAIGFDFEHDRATIRLRNQHGEHRLACGLNGAWLRATTPLSQPDPEPIAVSGAWTDLATFTFRICFTETPYCPTLTCSFEGDTLCIDYRQNCGFRSEPYPEIVGRLSSAPTLDAT